MTSFLLALGFIACFVLGCVVTFRICEYYNKLLRQAPKQYQPPIRKPKADPYDDFTDELQRDLSMTTAHSRKT